MRSNKNNKRKSERSDRSAAFAVVAAVVGVSVLGAIGAAHDIKAFSASDFVTGSDDLISPIQINPGGYEPTPDYTIPAIGTFPNGYVPPETTEAVVDDPFNMGGEVSETEETTSGGGIFSFDEETAPPEVSDYPSVTDVTEPPPPTLFLTYYTFDLTVGQEAQIYWWVENSDYSGYQELFSVDNPNVASVSESGIITALGAGTANITVTWGELTAEAKVTVAAGETSSVVPATDPVTNPITDPVTENTSQEETSPSQSESVPLPKAKLEGCLYNTSGIAIPDVVLRIGDRTAVTDRNGYFCFTETDMGEIRIFSALNERLSCPMNLTGSSTVFLLYAGESMEYFTSYEEMAARFVITDIELETPNKRIYTGDVLIPYFQYEPRDAALTDARYISSDENVAAVDENGVITAKAAGETVITLILNNGQAQTAFTLTVNPQEIGKYSGIIAAVEILIILIVLGSCWAVYKRYKRRIGEESAPAAAPQNSFNYASVTAEKDGNSRDDDGSETE